jgi:glycosyltransferase involved in cell wall biosynthesis
MKISDVGKVKKSGQPIIMIVATTPLAVNTFLANHMVALSEEYRIILCTNLEAHKLLPSLMNRIEVNQIPFARKVALGADLKSLFKLIMVVYRIKPEVIHSITPKAGLLGMLTGFILGVPNRWHTFTGQVWATRHGFVRRFLKALDRIIVLVATRVMADSASQCRFLRDEGVVGVEPVVVLGPGSISGVDFKRFCPDTVTRELLRKQLGVNTGVTVFLFIGRLTKDKGMVDLIEAFVEVAREVSELELWVVGPDEEGLMKSLRESAECCDAPIRWVGATVVPEQFMAAADILVLPSYREGFGSVIIEGAACGIPTIAYRIDGVIDAIVDGFSGLLVEVGKPRAFAAAMKTLALDGDLRERLGNYARQRAVRDFSSERITKAWIEFYRSRLKKSH